ncbi:MAG: hypothetical protein CTY22_06280 [Methylomonas sp.]|nr:MAG: hypothetical protein CTY23_08035 [Methylomonas sp.]PPD26109.1 MAG: hypothetical protein CTY22_06280 [Methylomonas sp.]PPD37825.1 MAG: hypothetical protein CTY21_06275 [Methylomonas sp.]PPD38616.1 MAG: hypothetical protein CTY17_09120 [Methylomonas sp.]PPD55325.1 MAG: hypothetical protein CTY11_01625 [Methylomonas sp.]
MGLVTGAFRLAILVGCVMRGWIVVLAVMLSASASAEVYKCIGGDGKTLYQSRPCQTSQREKQLDIKADPEREAAARARLQDVQAEYQARKEQRAQAENERLQKQYQAATLEAARRSAQAQHRQADALEQRQAWGGDAPLPTRGFIAPGVTFSAPIMPRQPASPAPRTEPNP